MAKESNIKREIEKLLSIMPKDLEFSAKWFKSTLNGLYGRAKDCYIPSDYCYNRKNNGINYGKQPHYFLYLGLGKYKYVGKDYKYTVEVEHRQRKLK